MRRELVTESVLLELEKLGRNIENFDIEVYDHATGDNYFVESLEPEYLKEHNEYYVLGVDEYGTSVEWLLPEDFEVVEN